MDEPIQAKQAIIDKVEALPEEARRALPEYLKLHYLRAHGYNPIYVGDVDPLNRLQQLRERDSEPQPAGTRGSIDRDLRAEWHFHNRRRTVRLRKR